MVNLLNAPKYTGSNTPQIRLICYKAACPDFEFLSIQDPRPLCTPATAEAQSGQVMWGKPSLSKSSRREGEFVEDIISRWYAMDPEIASTDRYTQFYYTSSSMGVHQPDPLAAISLSFLWRTGSLDYKVQCPPKPGVSNYSVSARLDRLKGQTSDLEVVTYYPPEFSRTGDGEVRLNTAFADVLEFSAPLTSALPYVPSNVYMSDYFFAVPTGGYGLYVPLDVFVEGSDETTVVPLETLRRASESFHFLCDVPPPNLSYWFYSGTGTPT